MAFAPVYSERFLAIQTPAIWVYYNVPVGRRVVVRSVTGVNNGAEAARFYLDVGGTLAAIRSLPVGGSVSFDLELRHVAYGGERIGGYVEKPSCHLLVSGYLLTTVPAASTGAGEQQPGPAPPYMQEPVPSPSGSS